MSPGEARRGGLRIAGYAALFGVADGAGDTIRPGAFVKALAKGGELPLFWQHDSRQRIGTVERIAEDGRGLRVIARIDKRESRAACLLRARTGAGSASATGRGAIAGCGAGECWRTSICSK